MRHFVAPLQVEGGARIEDIEILKNSITDKRKVGFLCSDEIEIVHGCIYLPP